jgi:hypothetical protein
MGMVRTNITLPADLLALIDSVAGPRGRSAYIADVVARQARRDNARQVFERYRGALKGSTTWGRTDEEADEYFRKLRAEWERPWIWEDPDAISARRDGVDRPRSGPARRQRADRVAVRGAE